MIKWFPSTIDPEHLPPTPKEQRDEEATQHTIQLRREAEMYREFMMQLRSWSALMFAVGILIGFLFCLWITGGWG